MRERVAIPREAAPEAAPAAAPPSTAATASSPTAQVLRMQATAGNQATAAALRRRGDGLPDHLKAGIEHLSAD